MKKEIDAFIYTASQLDDPKLKICLFVLTKLGSKKVVIDNWKGYFFVEDQKGEYSSLNHKKASKIFYESLGEKKELLKKHHSKQVFESDIRESSRFLMDLGIFGQVKILVDEKEYDKNVLINPELKPLENEERLPFKVFSFDIETSKDGRVISIAYEQKYLEQAFQKCLIISPEKINCDDLLIENFQNEKEMIQAFVDDLKKCDPEILIGWNVVNFDLKFLVERAKFHSIKLDIGKEGVDLELFQNLNREYQAKVFGRVVLDGPRTLKMNFFNFESFKLNSVAKALLNDAKDIDEDENISKWDEIERRFREDKLALVRYNLKDATLVNQIFEHTQLIDLLVSRSKISGMLLDRVGGSTTAFDFFFLPELHRRSIVAKNVEDVEFNQMASGGFVLTPQIGIHENILVLDFKSLYPTVIRTFNIDPLSLFLSNKNPKGTPVDVMLSDTEHILPNKISTLLEKRAEAKKNNNSNLSQAVKILMNSFYGVMGSSGCRFYEPRLPEIITGSGQWVLKTSIQFIEEELKLKVIYGDTDSLFVKLNSDFSETAIVNMIQSINDHLKNKILKLFNRESFLEIQKDKLYSKLILFPTRGSGEGAKKRYIGILKPNDIVEKNLIMTGVESVRSDWSLLSKDFQKKLCILILKGEPYKDFILETIQKLENGHFDQDLILRKRLTKPLDDYIKNVPPHVRSLKLFKEKYGYEKKISEYIMTKKGPVPMEFAPKDIDYSYYIEKQLAPIADSLLVFLDDNFEKVRNRQLSLF